jgi:putative redox protein
MLEVAEVEGVWLAGASTGGSLAMCVGGEDPRVRGVAALSARADFADWAAQPRRFLQHARDVGVVRDPAFPEDLEAWALELKSIRPLSTVASLAPRPLLLVQGAEDDTVPVVDARALADAHGSADLRVLSGAGHALRHDPRAVALLLGWLERQAGDATTPA